MREAEASNVSLDKTTLEFLLRRKIDTLAGRFAADPSNIDKLNDLRKALQIVRQIPFAVNLWSAQNDVYAIQNGLYQRMRKKAQRGDTKAQTWVESYSGLCDSLTIRLQ